MLWQGPQSLQARFFTPERGSQPAALAGVTRVLEFGAVCQSLVRGLLQREITRRRNAKKKVAVVATIWVCVWSATPVKEGVCVSASVGCAEGARASDKRCNAGFCCA